jgi:capsid portal protein
MEFAIGTEPYGEVRWIGQVLGVDGSRKAEGLNNNYFENGRHTPLMIMIEGGTLTDESFDKLQQYMNDIKGEKGQHAFIILETESSDGRVDFDQSEKPKIEVKDLANILQKDELFQDYLDNNRRKVQSSFQLPDLYVGYTTDFNRATAQTAQEVTEEQVFQPERKSLAWAINNRLLNGYQFQYVEAYFLEPNISNPDDLYKLLTVCNSAGGLTPNKAKQIAYEALGEVSEDYPDDWGNTPLAYSKSQSSGFDLGTLTMSVQRQIEKAASNHDDAVVAVMKEVKSLLLKMESQNK